MGILSIMEIGRTALAAQKAAIGVTGENIANVNTPGYSRQTAVLETAQFNPDLNPAVGSGVVLASIQRSYDKFLQNQMMSAYSSSGEQTTRQTALQRIEPLFSDLSGSGLGTSLGDFFNAWQDLSMNPQGSAERQSLLAKTQSLVEEFHQINNSLNSVKQDANQSLESITGNINSITSQIATLNEQIRITQLSGGNTNQLKDSRDVLVQDLSKKVGITSLEQTDGTITVSLARGPQLVDGYRSATMSLQSDASNAGLSAVYVSSIGGGNDTNVTSLLTSTGSSSGELGGALYVRDTMINGYLNNLDEIASSLTVEVNNLHSAGFSLNGSTGVNFFTPLATTSGASIAISLNIASADNIAAASADPTLAGSGTGNNKTALAIAALNNKALTINGTSSTLSEFYSSLVGKVGINVQATDLKVAQTDSMIKQLNNVHDSTSGVSLDEELLALTKYQKAFEGAAKLITTGQDMIDTILGMIR